MWMSSSKNILRKTLMDGIENSPERFKPVCEDERVLLCLVGFMGESGVRESESEEIYLYLVASRYKFSFLNNKQGGYFTILSKL
jgi:hypothetical protein